MKKSFLFSRKKINFVTIDEYTIALIIFLYNENTFFSFFLVSRYIIYDRSLCEGVFSF